MSINKKIWIGEVVSLFVCTVATFAATPILLFGMAEHNSKVTLLTVMFATCCTVMQIVLLGTLLRVVQERDELK